MEGGKKDGGKRGRNAGHGTGIMSKVGGGGVRIHTPFNQRCGGPTDQQMAGKKEKTGNFP